MIKKILSLFVLTVMLSYVESSAQCTPNTAIQTPGVYPDSATGLPPAYMGYTYSEVVQVRIPVDTIFQGNTVPIIDFTIDSVTGLPPSFSYACSPGSCVFPGGSNGCILLSGNPVAPGTFPIHVYGVAHGTLFGFPASLPFDLNYYKIVINPFSPAGIPQNSNYAFTVSQNEPNPFSTFSNINFTSPAGGRAELKIFNLIGKQVYSSAYRVITGKNTIRLDAKEFDSGVYMYTITLGERTITKRMVISRK